MSDSTGPEGAKCAQRGAQTVAERSAALSARLSDADAYERSMPLYFLIGCARSAADHGDDSLLRQIEQAFAHTLPVAGATR